MHASPLLVVVLAASALALFACEADDPASTAPPPAAGGSSSGGSSAGGPSAGGASGAPASGGSAGTAGSKGTPLPLTCDPQAGVTNVDTASCVADPSDYQPRKNNSADDTYPACSCDGGVLTPFGEDVGSNARTAAFEAVGPLLGFGTDKIPSAKDFEDARILLSADNGLESRYTRREDEHYPALAMTCQMLAAADQQANKDRCAGPAQILPLHTKAFQDAGAAGSTDETRVLAAARVEAAFIWFSYVSVYKEAKSCTTTIADCDSATGYYAGSQSRTDSKGWAKLVQTTAPETHEVLWDALQAVHCWREADSAPAATNLAARDKALAQLDGPLDRALAVIVRQRIKQAACGRSWEVARILGGVLGRAGRAANPTGWATVEAELGKADGTTVDVAAAVGALDAVFPCP